MMPIVSAYPNVPAGQPEWEHLQQGTREQYTSDWRLVPGGHTEEFRHGLSEIPWVVSVLRSDTVAGDFPRHIQGKELYGRLTFDPSDHADGTGETSSGITVTGAALGDFVQVSAPYDLQDIIVTGYVSAADTVEIRIQLENAGANVDLASGVWIVRVTSLSDASVDFKDEDDVVGTGTEIITVTSNLASGTDKYFQVRAM